MTALTGDWEPAPRGGHESGGPEPGARAEHRHRSSAGRQIGSDGHDVGTVQRGQGQGQRLEVVDQFDVVEPEVDLDLRGRTSPRGVVHLETPARDRRGHGETGRGGPYPVQVGERSLGQPVVVAAREHPHPGGRGAGRLDQAEAGVGATDVGDQ